MKRKLKKIVLKKHEKDNLQGFVDRRHEAYVSFQLASRFARDAETALMERLYRMFPIMKIGEAMATLKHPKKGNWTIEYYEHEEEK